jgi:hypothetical protein
MYIYIGIQILDKSRRQLKILDVRRATWRKLNNGKG